MANTLLAWFTKPGKTLSQGTCIVLLFYLCFFFFLIVIGAERGVKKLANVTLILIFKQNLMIS